MKNVLTNEIGNLLTKKSIEKIGCNDCPQGGDASNCSNCFYNGDYFYLNGECVDRQIKGSKWTQIRCCDLVYSGTNDEIIMIPLMGWTNSTEQTPENGEIIAVVWENLSKKNTKGIDYKNEEAKDDTYALSCIIEILRDLLSRIYYSNGIQKTTKEYEILVSYLRASNFNEDGSPSDDDTYYKVIRMPANSSEEALEDVEEFIFESSDLCGIEDDYVEDTLEVVKMLSEVGHMIK